MGIEVFLVYTVGSTVLVLELFSLFWMNKT